MAIEDKEKANYFSYNGMTGHVARWYFLQSDGNLYRWSVKNSCWVSTSMTLNGLVKIEPKGDSNEQG